MFNFFKKKKKISLNTHSILHENLSLLPQFLLFKAKIKGDYYTFNIITFKRMCELAIKDKKKITNPHDVYNRQIPLKVIGKAKKFWKKCIHDHSLVIVQKLIEYDYPTNLTWPIPPPPYPRGVRLMWVITPDEHDLRPLLASFSIYYNNKPINSEYYYLPRYMETEKYRQIDTASTSFVAVYYINELWSKRKLVKRPFMKSDCTINILDLFKPLVDPDYWKINKEYTTETFQLWFNFIENLKIQ